MEALIDVLRRVVGDGWLLIVLLAIVGVGSSGIIPKWMSERRSSQAAERERLSADQLKLIENYEAEAENQRRWRMEDAERYEKRIGALDNRIEQLIEAAVLSERGNARLRHTLHNFVGVIIGQHDLALLRGEESPFPIEWLRGLRGISDDLDEKLRALFHEAGAPPPDTPTSTC